MKFFWADPIDLIDPSFDFISDKGRYGVTRQQEQLFPHEVFSEQLYHGFVVSKINVEKGFKNRWSSSQMSRFYRQGARRFLRLPSHLNLEIIGDSGAYSRTSLDQPSHKLIDECIEVADFYSAVGVDYGLSPDNVISRFWIEGKSKSKKVDLEEWHTRWNRTIELADTFYTHCKRKKVAWKPIGVVQGWNPDSYKKAVTQLQEIGYDHIAIGGLNRLDDEGITSCVEACSEVKKENNVFHLLGVCRYDLLEKLNDMGINSFDSAMPVRQAISDDRHNYHTADQNYLAIRVPQTYASPKLIRMVERKVLDHHKLNEIEQRSLKLLRGFDAGKYGLDEVMQVLTQGITYRREKDFSSEYRRILTDKPWKKCKCNLCKDIGIEIIILRNRERNLRRGFHNLYVLSQKMKDFNTTNYPKHDRIQHTHFTRSSFPPGG